MYNGNSTLRWIFWILALIVLVIAISSGIKKHREEKKEKQKTEIQKGKTEYIEDKWIRYDSIMISLYDDFGEIQTLNYDDRFTFEESTQPYCVINSNDYSECGEKGQDVSKNMGTDNANKKLRFRNNSRKYGHLKLVIWRKIRIKKYI